MNTIFSIFPFIFYFTILLPLSATPHVVKAVSFSNNGKLAVSGDSGSVIRIFDTADYKVLYTFFDETYDNDIFVIKFAANDNQIISGSKSGLKLWDFRNGKVIRSMPTRSVISLDVHGNHALSGNWAGELQYWNIHTGKLIWSHKGSDPNINSVSILKNGNYAISGGDDGKITLWDLKSGKPIRILARTASLFRSIDVSKNNTLFAADGPDHSVVIKSIFSDHMNYAFSDKNQTINALKLSPSESIILTAGTNGIIYIYNYNNGKEIARLIGHDDIITSLDISPDGRTAISGSWDTTVKFWSIENSTLLHTYGESTFIPGPPSPFSDFSRAFNTIIILFLVLCGLFILAVILVIAKVKAWISHS